MTYQQCSYILSEEYMFVLFNSKNNYGTPIYLNASGKEVSTGLQLLYNSAMKKVKSISSGFQGLPLS